MSNISYKMQTRSPLPTQLGSRREILLPLSPNNPGIMEEAEAALVGTIGGQWVDSIVMEEEAITISIAILTLTTIVEVGTRRGITNMIRRWDPSTKKRSLGEER
jgi:hypothetical protein